MFGKKKKGKERILSDGNFDEQDMELFHENRRTVKELIAPGGINPNPYDYMVIDDNGIPLYTMCFYIDKLPRKATFASTFAPVFDFPEVTSNVFINPLSVAKSSKMLDKRIVTLDTERYASEQSGDRNQLRKLLAKMSDAERYAIDVESGDNKLYDVQFLFTVQAVSLERLHLVISDLQARAKNKGIELAACYSVHPEAFVSGYTTNRVFKARAGLITSDTIKTHTFDKGALATIFNHTSSSFSHEGGIIAGRNMSTGQVVPFNVYDVSHNGYGLIICGKTGTGKSATIKIFLSRYIDFGFYIRSIDFEKKGTRGEYSNMAEKVGGVNFEIKQNSDNILNLFELDVEEEFDETTQREYPVLHLAQKVVDVSNLITIMVKNGNTIDDFGDATTVGRIITDTVFELYSKRGIKDEDVDSIYKTGTTLDGGKLSSGKVKKLLPTITDFYKLILVKNYKNKDTFHDKGYKLILDSMKDYVKELYYCPQDATFFTREEFLALETEKSVEGDVRICPECGEEVVEIHGVRAYFDGQSTVKADQNTKHINIDISSLTEREKEVALLVSTNFMQEQYVKKNSANLKKAKKMVLLIDEVHKTFRYPEARIFINDMYRTARKRNVSPWIATQALADFSGYKETREIVKQTSSLLLLKQDYMDREYIKESTPLTDSEIEMVLSMGGDPDDPKDKLERKGEICMIDNGKVVFLKVDYLTDTESSIVETDIEKISQMYKGEEVS